MEAAMDDVRSEELSLLRAAKLHDVPKSTLHDRVSGKVLHGHKPDTFLLLKKKNLQTF